MKTTLLALFSFALLGLSLAALLPKEVRDSIDGGVLCPTCLNMVQRGEDQGANFTSDWLQTEIKNECMAAFSIAKDCTRQFNRYAHDMEQYIKQKLMPILACAQMTFC